MKINLGVVAVDNLFEFVRLGEVLVEMRDSNMSDEEKIIRFHQIVGLIGRITLLLAKNDSNPDTEAQFFLKIAEGFSDRLSPCDQKMFDDKVIEFYEFVAANYV